MTNAARVRFIALLAIVAVILGACEVKLDVAIDIEGDGGGTVTATVSLDEDAVERGPDDLARVLRSSDLSATDWEITGPETDGGITTIVAAKRFAGPEQLQTVLDELTGDDGMFQNFSIDRETEFAIREFEVEGQIDLRRGVTLFNDPEITVLLDGNPFGKPVEEYLDVGQSLDDAVPVSVTVTLPGEGDAGSGNSATYTPRFDDTQPTDVLLSAVEDNFLARLLRWIGMAAAALFALSAVLAIAGFFLDQRARSRRPRIQTPAPMATRVPIPVAAPAPGAPRAVMPQPVQAPVPVAPAPAPSRNRLRVVVVEPLGVLYDVGDNHDEHLVNMARQYGSTLAPEDVRELHREVTLGRISTREFWGACGTDGDPDALDREYISYFRPRAGAAEFLREMRRRQMPVAALTNDASRWSTLLRERDNLTSLHPWLVSADVGARKPDPGLYEAMRRELAVPYEGCLCIDVDPDHLDTAKTLGMQTAFLADKRPSPDNRPNHPVITSFSDFFKRR